jgi:RNA polymerase sigma-70 factor, ECF subfamily
VIEPTTDAEIIVASFDEPQLFAVIFDRHYRAVYRFVVGAVGPSDGPDIAAEVFARAFEFRRRYDPIYKHARPWLWGIASNLVNDYYRRRARQKRAYWRVFRPDLYDLGFDDDVVSRVAAEAERPHIASAILQLRSEEAEVVLLFVLGAMSYAEIAQSLGIPEGTVRSRLSRGRKRLRNLTTAQRELDSNDE